MKTKNFVTAILILFIIISIGYLLAKENKKLPKAVAPQAFNAVENKNLAESPPQTSNENSEINASEENLQHRLRVYYFHGDKRCAKCLKIEAYAKEAVETFFPDELASGKIIWQVVNVDQPENAHFNEDFGLTTRSLVLVSEKSGTSAASSSTAGNGKQKNYKVLHEVWDYVDDKEAFMEYVYEETLAYLNKYK